MLLILLFFIIILNVVQSLAQGLPEGIVGGNVFVEPGRDYPKCDENYGRNDNGNPNQPDFLFLGLFSDVINPRHWLIEQDLNDLND
jgi:hypothetical protein